MDYYDVWVYSMPGKKRYVTTVSAYSVYDACRKVALSSGHPYNDLTAIMQGADKKFATAGTQDKRDSCREWELVAD